MMNLFEIMQAAQGGNAMQNLARQFGLSAEQAQSAVDALLPAMSAGLQQQASTLEGFATILGTLGQASPAAEAFDSDGDGIPDHLEEQGNAALGTVFGGPEVQQAVANQAAQFAGLSSSMVQQMMPAVMAMLMGGLFKGAANNGLGGLLQQMAQGGLGNAMGGAGGGLGGMLGQILGGQGGMFGNAMAPQPAQNPMGGLLGQILGGFMGANQQAGAQPGGLGGLLGGLFGGGAAPRAPEASPPPVADPMAAGLEALRGMFHHGQNLQSSQMDAITQVLQQFTQNSRR